VKDKMVSPTEKITVDGRQFALRDLSQGALDIVDSIQFVNARLQELDGSLAASQTAHVVYARALKAELLGTSTG